MDIFTNRYIRITKENDGYYLESFEKGFTIQDFNLIVQSNPDMKINSFAVIRHALLNGPQPPSKFGDVRERIVVEITNNDLSAFLTVKSEEQSSDQSNKYSLVREIVAKLQEKGVLFDIKTEVLMNLPQTKSPILIAEGVPPVNGEDSVIRMFELKEPQPEIKEDGKADHYELNLINKVNAGDWLGERTDPTEGIPGKTVKGDIIKPLAGKLLPLFYDPNTVQEVHKEGITTLYSKINGAIHYKGDKISVSNYLEISQDVGFNTGNIDFDGFLTVKGAITDNFSIVAKDDVEILGEFGIGSVKEVLSRNGNIFIKGGIAGKNKAVIKSSKDIYTKFISDATVICDGILHVGYYCLNSNITAKQLVIESGKGQIIGGNIQVEQRVSAAHIGNAGEKRTCICVKGFDRQELKEELEEVQQTFQESKLRLAKAKQLFSIFPGSMDVKSRQYNEYEKAKENYFNAKDEVKHLENKLKTLIKYFKVKGEGEISVSKKLYPNTCLTLGKNTKEIRVSSISCCFFLQDGNIREI